MDERGRKCLGLKEWYSPLEGSNIEVDIIAVHGLAANPYWTWVAPSEDQNNKHWRRLLATSRAAIPSSGTNPANIDPPSRETEIIWLEKFLPDIVPNSRIMTFGYQSNFMRSAPKRTTSNCAQELLNALLMARSSEEEKVRPITFIGHCFGGIVIKEALIKSTLASNHYGSIRMATRGIIFLGTPHRGTNIASYGDMLVSITKAAGLGSDTQLIRGLRQQSAEMLKLASNFNDIYNSFDIFCFYELLPWRFGAVIVTEQSAIIEGRPSEGLNKDHSGLNKYGSRDDYSFCRVAREIKRMVGSASARAYKRDSSENPLLDSEVSRPFKPWEDMARFVISIEECFDQKMAMAKIYHQPQSLNVSRHRFRAWTYSTGLSKVDNPYWPLHEVLDTHVAHTICAYLQQILQYLSKMSEESSMSEVQHRKLLDMINELYFFLPEEDRATSGQIFSATLLRSEDTSSLEDLRSDPMIQQFPDIELIAAMKRINILQESAEATRPTMEKLSLKMDDLSLDRAFSSKTTGTYRSPGAEVNEPVKQVLIEWKHYKDYWDSEIGNQLFNRTEMLTHFLRQASQSSTILDLRILHCLGYCHDDKRKRLGFIFSIPACAGNKRCYLTLNSWIMQNVKRPALLGDRFRLAETLCRAMFAFHRARWFHKSFSSHNIAFFSDTDSEVANDEDPTSTSLPSAADCSLIAPYIMGFDHSRPDRPTEFSEPAHQSLDILRYRHWEYRNSPMRKYKYTYDYYSLGMVLLEIGLWFPLSGLMKRHASWAQLDAKAFADRVREEFCPQLGSFVGAVYQSVVADLLGGEVDGESPVEGQLNNQANDQVLAEVMPLIQYQTAILERLSRCSA